jgi:hypothetical protein
MSEPVERWRTEIQRVRWFLELMSRRQATIDKKRPPDWREDPMNEEIPFMLAEAVSRLSFRFRLQGGGPVRGPEREGWHLVMERQTQGLLSQVWLDLLAAFFQGRLVAVCDWCFTPYLTDYKPRRGQPHYCLRCRGVVKLRRYRARQRLAKEDSDEQTRQQ